MANYSEHYLENSSPWQTGESPVTGCCYNDHAYLFFMQRIAQHAGHETRIACTKTRSAGSGIEVIWSNKPVIPNQPVSINGKADVMSFTACTHAGVMYVFFSNRSGSVARTSTMDGENWTAPVFFDGFIVDGERQISAASIGQRMFVFGSRHHGGEDKAVVAWSDDGQTWGSEVREEWRNVGNISICAFVDQSGSPSLKYAMATKYWNVWSGIYNYETGGSGSGLYVTDIIEHTEFRGSAEFVAVAAGSAKGGNHGQIVQMLVNGWHRKTWVGWKPQQKKEYCVKSKTWYIAESLNEGYARYPQWAHYGLFTYVRAISATELRQEIWYVFNYHNVQSSLYVARWESDELVRDDFSTLQQPVSRDFRSLIGVVEGPPPYILNGQPFRDSVSRFQFGYTTSLQTSVTATIKIGVQLKIGGKSSDKGFPLLGSFQLGSELTRKTQTTSEISQTFEKIIAPIPGKNESTYIYLKPVITRYSFKLKDWSGQEIPGVVVYTFTVSDAGIDFDMKKNLDSFPGKPDTNSYQTWLGRFNGTPEYADSIVNVPVEWTESGETKYTLKSVTTELQSRDDTVKAEVKAGIDNIFEIGGNASFSYTVEKKTTKTESIVVTLAYPRGKGEPEDIVKVGLRVFVWSPREGFIDKCYWIPEKARDQRPWLVAWSIDFVEKESERQL
ncbi:hypothetical protein [Paenibacillus glycanilyticus]|uniref:hypothetical protein n=1 Tax=Paenibacillus glycanilyticus TaxID=126569 RepID=UPI000FDAECED|nr:hypothetical protein [Paenibacillus glycanilyticus]